MLSIVLVVGLLLSSVVSARPGPPPAPQVALFNLPAAVTPPGKTTLQLVYQGYGTQNYTCNATTGTYLASGTAEAKLLDVTQFYTGTSLPSSQGPIQLLTVAGSHYYVPNPLAPTTNVPRFDDCTGFFIGTKNATVANSLPTYSVATVLLQNVQSGKAGGSLADWVVRTDVVGGVTPTALDTCVAGDAIAIPYKAHYLFFKNSS